LLFDIKLKALPAYFYNPVLVPLRNKLIFIFPSHFGEGAQRANEAGVGVGLQSGEAEPFKQQA
jgi:hypothetical protein